MKEFKGSVVHGAGTSYYRVRWAGCLVPLCHTELFYICNVKFLPDNWSSPMPQEEREEYLNKLSYAWGYEGHGPALLAVVLLAFYGAQGHILPTLGHLHDAPDPKREGTYNSQVAFVKEHYQAFTSEVIANLPDNWTMTMEDIDKWVKEKEKT